MSIRERTRDVDAALRGLADAFRAAAANVEEADWIEFFVGDLYIIANVLQDADRVRLRVYLPADDQRVVREWVEAQLSPWSGLLQWAYFDNEADWHPRLVFERPLRGWSWADDPLFEEVDRYRAAWQDDAPVPPPADRGRFVFTDDPRKTTPASAWLLKGDEASFPDAEDVQDYREAAQVGLFTCDWTVSAQTQVGDLVLLYFLDPRKAVHFVARAASRASFSRDVEVNSTHSVNQAQWWARLTPPIEIEALSVTRLREAAGGHLPLRGRSGLYLRPETISALDLRAVNPAQQAELERLVTTPVGLADLPQPCDVTHGRWRDLASGALPLEAHVSSHLVEPLLRMTLAGTGLTWRREYRVGRRWADFVIVDGETPVHVIEVKKVIKNGPGGGWRASPDIEQLLWYSTRLRVPGTLIDSHSVLMIPQAGSHYSREVRRSVASAADLAAIREHLLTLAPR